MSSRLGRLLIAIMLIVILVPTSSFAVDVPGTITVNSGGRDIQKSGTIGFPAVTLQGVDQTVAATTGPVFTIFDGTGSNAGWKVTFQATAFADDVGSIAATNFTFNPNGGVSTFAVDGTGGQAVDASNGPKEFGGGAVDLSAARQVVTTAAGYGKGKYTWTPAPGSFGLTIPATTLRGTGNFTSTLTATIVAGP